MVLEIEPTASAERAHRTHSATQSRIPHALAAQRTHIGSTYLDMPHTHTRTHARMLSCHREAPQLIVRQLRSHVGLLPVLAGILLEP